MGRDRAEAAIRPPPTVQTGRRTCWYLSSQQVSSQPSRPDLTLSPHLKPPPFLLPLALQPRVGPEVVRVVAPYVKRSSGSGDSAAGVGRGSEEPPPAAQRRGGGEGKEDAVAVAPPLKGLAPCPRRAFAAGPGRPVRAAGSPALPARSPAASRAQPRRGAACPPPHPRISVPMEGPTPRC